jgi:Lon-like ATP-dependent protease
VAPSPTDKATETVETQQADTKPASEALPSDDASKIEEGQTTVTTKPREPLDLPSGISIRVTQDNLKEYVGPTIYHKDRLYTKAPPAGVSTGLGYLGNGSGAVMPIEVTVSLV